MVSKSSENKKLGKWKASPTGDTIHFARHTFNLIFFFSFLSSSSPSSDLKGAKTGPSKAECAQGILAGKSDGFVPSASPPQGRSHFL